MIHLKLIYAIYKRLIIPKLKGFLNNYIYYGYMNFWGYLENRTGHRKKAMQIAKYFIYEDLQSIIYGILPYVTTEDRLRKYY